MNDQMQQTGPVHETTWQRRIRERCVERGWDDGELARRAGVARSTLYYLRQGTTQRPRASTLNGIARALQIDPRSLTEDPGDSAEPPDRETAKALGEEGHFDRLTNPLVDVVRRERPEIFDSWNQAEWDELYSAFGTGGRLTEEGVTAAAEKMNRRRQTMRRLQIIMETHLAEVAERMVETLFEMTRPESNLADSSQLQQLLSNVVSPKMNTKTPRSAES